jgi:beta-glucanase (GH16 family)
MEKRRWNNEQHRNYQMKLMFKFLTAIVIFSLCCSKLSAQNIPSNLVFLAEKSPCATGEYELVFEDDFDGASLDTNKWHPFIPTPKPWDFIAGGTCDPANWEFVSPDNIVLQDGILHLLAKKETTNYSGIAGSNWSSLDDGAPVGCGLFKGDPFNFSVDYTEAYINSKQSFKYGLFEIRCKISKSEGFNPAFWLYSGKSEIDGFEFFPPPTRLCTNAHIYEGGYSWSKCYDDGTDYSQDFHDFAIEWTPYKVSWLVDGRVFRNMYRYMRFTDSRWVDCQDLKTTGLYFENALVPQTYLTIIANTNVVEDKLPSDHNPFPTQVDVDYIRVYQRTPSSQDSLLLLPVLSIYPNPADKELNFELENFDIEVLKRQETKWELINNMHQVVLSRLSKNNFERLDTSDLANGIYTLYAIIEGRIVAEKVVIHHP